MSADPAKPPARPKRSSSAAVGLNRSDTADKSSKAPAADAGPADAVERLAHALLREYMHRRGFKRTLQAFDAESPRDERTISSRQVMGGMLSWTSAMDRMQAESQFFAAAGGADAATVLAAAPPGTFMEQLCSFRLRRRMYVQHPELRHRVVEGGVLEALTARAATASGGFVEGDIADTDASMLTTESERLRDALAAVETVRADLADARARAAALRARAATAEGAMLQAEAEANAAAAGASVVTADHDGSHDSTRQVKDKELRKDDLEKTKKEKKSKKDKNDKKEKAGKEKKSKSDDKKEKKDKKGSQRLSSSTGGLAFDPLGLTSGSISSVIVPPVPVPALGSTAALSGRGSRWAPEAPILDGPDFAPMPTSVRAAFGASTGGSPNARVGADGGLGLGYLGARPSSAPAAIRKPVISSSPPSAAAAPSSSRSADRATTSGTRPASAGAAPRDASVKSAIAGGRDAKPARVRLVQFVDA